MQLEKIIRVARSLERGCASVSHTKNNILVTIETYRFALKIVKTLANCPFKYLLPHPAGIGLRMLMAESPSSW